MAFLKNSRYHGLPTVEVKTKQGRSVIAVALRVLPSVGGSTHKIQEDDRLDVIADRSFEDPTRFWHVADVNSEIEAGRLIEPGREIDVPKRG